MENLYISILLLALLALVIFGASAFVARTKKTSLPELPYKKQQYFLSQAERSFFGVLQSAVGNDSLVFAKVRLVDLVWLPKGTTNRQSYLNRVISKHVDFVLCDPQTVAPILVIELDDKSHQTKHRQERDEFVDAVLGAAGIPILRVRAKQGYSAAELSAEILRTIRGEEPAATV